jgi:hypothetical protein
MVRVRLNPGGDEAKKFKAKRRRSDEDQTKKSQMKLTDRNSPGFLQPWDPLWAEHHVLYPKQGGQSEEGAPGIPDARGVYLHDYPLPVAEILHFFGFNVEAGTTEIWKEEKRVFEADEIDQDRPYVMDAMGTYTPATRTVTLYLPTIRDCAKKLGVDEEGVREVVRVHEYMHALHHLGAPANARFKLWQPLEEGLQHNAVFLAERWALKEAPTALAVFLASRDHWFGKLGSHRPSRRLEFVAQAGTVIYADYLEAVYGPRPDSRCSLREIFWRLMKEQVDPYLLDAAHFPKGSWPALGASFRVSLRSDWERIGGSAEEVFREKQLQGIAAEGLKGQQAQRALDFLSALG